MKLTETLARQVFELLVKRETTQAVALVRTQLSASLQQAIAAVAEVRAACFEYRASSVISFEVFAHGPYSANVSQHLEYPPKFYASLTTGTEVVAVPFDVFEVPTATAYLYASALGVDDLSDFSKHIIEADSIDYSALSRILAQELEISTEEAAAEFAALRALASNGFALHLRIEPTDGTAPHYTPKGALPWE